MHELARFQGHWDPYVWMDVVAWSECVGFVAKALGEFDPSNSQYYEQNAKEYREELKELDDYVKQVIRSVPEKQRVLLTTHDEFGYFGDAYNIEVLSVHELTYQEDIGDITRLVDTIVERQIGAVFVETSVLNRRITDAVIDLRPVEAGRSRSAVRCTPTRWVSPTPTNELTSVRSITMRPQLPERLEGKHPRPDSEEN